MHFPEDEYIQICKLVSDKINEFINVFKTTQLNHIISQKLNEISDVIMNCVEYPKQTFIVQELFLGCQILLLSNDIKMIQDVLRFLSLAIYSTDNLSESLSIFFPLIFNLNERNDIFVKRYFSFATNVFTDLKKNHNFVLINQLIVDYFNIFMIYITSLTTIYNETLIFIMILSSLITAEKYPEIYLQLSNYLLNLLNDQRILLDEKLHSIVLWSIYENCKHSIGEFINFSHSSAIIRYFVDQVQQYDTLPCCCIEPILIILYLCLCFQKNSSFIFSKDLPVFINLCFSSNPHIQFNALQLSRVLVQFFPSELLNSKFLEIINIFQDVQFRSAHEIYMISCSLLYFMSEFNIVSNNPLVKQLILFVIQNINIDDESSKYALLSLIKIQDSFIKFDKLQCFQKIFGEANQFGSFDELRLNESEEILDLIDKLDPCLLCAD